MFDFESRKIIEALRSGVPSRDVGRYFTQARHELVAAITGSLDRVRDSGNPDGIIVSGRYGEGKTHMLNTVFSIAHEKNMAVSMISLSKETPMDKLPFILQKVAVNTYLPGKEQPGLERCFDGLTYSDPRAKKLLEYAANNLETNKLYFVLASLLKTEDAEMRFKLLADLEGDFIANAELKRIYRSIFGEPAKFNVNFSKTKHTMDYFMFMSRMISVLGCDGWVILFDEMELTGRLGKKASQKAYRNMTEFLPPLGKLAGTFSMFAVSASYVEDVIEGKHEYENLEELFPDDTAPGKLILDMISGAEELKTLTRDEVTAVITGIMDYHSRAYDWNPDVSVEKIVKKAESSGYLLRSRVRTAIEILDQLYQYGKIGNISLGGLSTESYEELPSLEDLPED